MERELRIFVERLLSEVRDQATGGGPSGTTNFKENAFTEIVIDHLCEIGMVENGEVCHYETRIGRGIAKVNGFGFNDEKDTLDVFTSVFLDSGNSATVHSDDIRKSAERAARFVEACFGGIHQGMEVASDAYSMASRTHELEEHLDRIRIFVLSDCVAQLKQLDATEINGIPARFEIWDCERLFRGMQSGLPRDEIEIDFEEMFGEAVPCLILPQPLSDYTTYLAILSGDMIYRLYDEYGPRLLELNVRSFLQARGKVNRGIRDTLRDEPERFMAYNNGISITVDELMTVVLPDGRPAIKSVRGLQVVNGGQTTVSVHRAKKHDGADMSSVFVPAKITRVTGETLDEIVPKISRYANTQNVIQMADFSANDPFHVEIERLSQTIWCPGEQGRWFYERARGQYQVAKARFGTTPARSRRFREQTPPARKFTKTDLAKFQNCWNQRPDLVSRGAQKNFDVFMQELRVGKKSDWLPDGSYYKVLIAKAILYKTVTRIVRQEGFPAYRANIVAYLIAYVSSQSGGRLDMELIWRKQVLSGEFEELLRSWSNGIDEAIRTTANGRNVTEWCKKEDCWKSVRNTTLELSDPMPPELRGHTVPSGHRPTPLTPVDYENIAECKKLDGEQWLKIHAWGVRTGLLKGWQCGIAQTLSGYAANDWDRAPSQKQAKHGVTILEIAKQHDAEINRAS
ncbi:MAG: AIPR family protein [Acidobacteriia bacterium]|nr:AIPR family protein [Terriglobia bacterium]